MVMIAMACDRELVAFIAVAATMRLLDATSIISCICCDDVTFWQVKPSAYTSPFTISRSRNDGVVVEEDFPAALSVDGSDDDDNKSRISSL